MYATFADSQVYCEACYKNYETDKLVKATTAKLDSAKPADLLAESEEPAFSIPDKRKNLSRYPPWFLLILCRWAGLGSL
jgi:glycyl-tRNA synthetase (class II)